MCIDKKDYEAALVNLNKVIEDDENFKDAQTKYGEHKDNYRNVVLDKIEKEEDYDRAIVMINKALDLLKNDSILTTKKKQYDELNEKKKQEDESTRIEDLKNKQQLVVTNVKVDGVGFLNSNDVYVTVKNNSNKVVKSYIVGMLCFDANGYPVIPEYSIENENIEYGQCTNNIQPGKSYGSRAYFTIFSDTKLYVKACVESVEYHDGSTWENGYFDYWMHENKSKY